MASISELRTGIANNLATITGLRTSSFVPDNPNHSKEACKLTHSMF